MNVELIDCMGTDLTVVNAARVSFDKHHETITRGDEKLISYLASHKHYSPFRHCFATFRIEAPIFVARQLAKNQVGMSWNEVSRRYVSTEPKFYYPKEWWGAPVDKKQGSSDIEIDMVHVGESQAWGSGSLYTSTIDKCLLTYNSMIKSGIAPEMARMVLPQSMYTSWYWSGSLQAFANLCNLRIHADAQKETKYVAEQIEAHMKELFPLSWKALREKEDVH